MFSLNMGSIRLRKAAKRFARELPRKLSNDYGASKTYTPPQIVRAVERAGLPTDYICLGFAAFLTEETFNSLGPRSFGMTYQDMRSLLKRYTHPDVVSAQSWPNGETVLQYPIADGVGGSP